MRNATLAMAGLALVLVVIAYQRGDGSHVRGIKDGGRIFLQVLPLLLCAFAVMGLAGVLVPKELVSKWLGKEAGVRGIFVGCLLGGITPGGPYVTFPIMLTLVRAGSSMGTVVAFITAWSLWAFARLPMEVGVVGPKIALVRFLANMVFPPIAGFIAEGIVRRIPILDVTPPP